jgi:hypothetical protein
MATLDELYKKALAAREILNRTDDDLAQINNSKPVQKDVLLKLCLGKVLFGLNEALNKVDSIQSNLSYGANLVYEIDGLKGDNERLIRRVDELKARIQKLSKLVPEGQLAPDELDELQRGQVINTIKMVRERTGLGLKEAKDLVEAIRDSAKDIPF